MYRWVVCDSGTCVTGRSRNQYKIADTLLRGTASLLENLRNMAH